MPFVLMTFVLMTFVLMTFVLMTFVLMTYVLMTYVLMTYVLMTYVLMTYVLMTYVLMTFVLMTFMSITSVIMNYAVNILSLIGTNNKISNYLNANGINSNYTILVIVITQTSSDAFSSNYFTSDNINFIGHNFCRMPIDSPS
jgi:hypothetical protein